jgi:hypothetical protein
MNALIAVALVLIPAQEKSVEERIAAFAKGDAAARESLLKLGVFAIRPLQKARDKAPDKIDALVFELKKIAAYPKDPKWVGSLGEKGAFKLGAKNYREALMAVQEKVRFTIVFDAFESTDLAAEEVTVDLAEGTPRQALDLICRQAGRDYGFFHNVLVVGKPERLWPDEKQPARAFGPPAAEKQHKKPDDEKALKTLRASKVSVDLQNADIATMLNYIGMIVDGVPMAVEGDPDKKALTLRAADQSVFDILSVATQIRDLDFMLKEGGVVIDTREEIAKKIAGKK